MIAQGGAIVNGVVQNSLQGDKKCVTIITGKEKIDKHKFEKGGFPTKKWYQWLFLSLGFCIGGALNCFDGKACIASFIPAVVTTLLSVIHFFCDKKGDAGKRAFQYISIYVIVLLALSLIILLV